jgi:hypothetical protein
MRLWLILGWLLAGPLAAQEAARPSGPSEDPRSVERLGLLCRNALGERTVTLFANGTLRLREKSKLADTLRLAELNPDELRTYLERLAQEDLSETQARYAGPEGSWIDRCRLTLALPEREPQSFEYTQYSSLSLGLSNIVTIVKELAARTAFLERHLPASYRPRRGDILERKDGTRYRVAGYTTDKKGVEVAGLDQPFTLYVPVTELAREFVAVLAEAPEDP